MVTDLSSLEFDIRTTTEPNFSQDDTHTLHLLLLRHRAALAMGGTFDGKDFRAS